MRIFTSSFCLSRFVDSPTYTEEVKSVSNVEHFRHGRHGLILRDGDYPGVLTRDSLSSGEWDSALETTRRDAPSFTQWIREHGIQNRKAIFIIRPSCFYDDTRTKLSRYVFPAIVVDLIHDYFSTRKTLVIDETFFWIRFYPDIVMDLIWEIRQIQYNKIKGNIRIKMCSIPCFWVTDHFVMLDITLINDFLANG